MGRDGRKISAF